MHQSSNTNLHHPTSSVCLLNGPSPIYQSFNNYPINNIEQNHYISSLSICSNDSLNNLNKFCVLNKNHEFKNLLKTDKYYAQKVNSNILIIYTNILLKLYCKLMATKFTYIYI